MEGNQNIGQLLGNQEIQLQDVRELTSVEKEKVPVIYKNIQPETYEDVFKLYHYAIYPHYLNNIPAVYLIKNLNAVIKKLESIKDPPPISCPLTGEKTVIQLRRLKIISKIEELTTWVKWAINKEEVEIRIKTPLAPDQEEAAAHFLGPAQTIAPAGAGKTSTLVTRNVVLVKRKIPPEKILCITFTRKAQEEMQERLINALGKETGTKIMVKTYHALAYYLLKIFTGNKKLEIITSRTAILGEILSSSENSEKEISVEDLDQYISLMLNDLKEPGEIEALTEKETIYIELYSKYLEKLRERNIYDQDYLLYSLYQLLKKDKEKRKIILEQKNSQDPEYPGGLWMFVMIDESQDNNRAQDILTQFLCAWDNIMWVGDDDQSLYSFRGSNVERFLRLVETYPNLREIYLRVNYRCHPEIVETANKLIQHNQVRKLKEIIAHRKDNYKAVTFKAFRHMMNETIWVAQRIKELVEDGFSPGDIAVLYRTNNQGDAVAELLAAMEIPYQINRSGPSLWECVEMEVILNHLTLATDPDNKKALIDCLRTPYRTEHIEKYAKELEKKPYPLDSLKAIADELKDYKVSNFCEEMRITNLIAQGLPNTGEIIGLIRGKFKDIAIYFQGKEGTDRFNIIEDLATKFTAPTDFIKWVKKIKMRKMNKDTTGDDSVKLMTVHSAKGLEFPVVFLINCTDGKFPHSNGDISEERRIFYVGITRARDYLYFTGYMTDKRGLSEFLWEAGVC